MRIKNEIPDVHPQELAIDIEMFGQVEDRLHRPHGTFACISIFLPSEPDTVYQIYDPDQLPKLFSELALSSVWIFQNALYDLRQLRKFVSIPRHYIHDTMLVEQVAFSGYYTDFSLKAMVRRYLDISMSKAVRRSFETSTVMTDEMKEYAAKDAILTYEVYEHQLKLKEATQILDVYDKIDEPAIWAVLDMSPIKIDQPLWLEIATQMEARGKEIEAEIKLNSMSPDQVKEAISKRLHIKLETTRAEVLEELMEKENDELLSKIMEARKCRKNSSTYGKKWIKNHVEADGLVCPDWRVIGAETGRMSCSSPNMQNIPMKAFPKYRDAIIPSRDKLVVMDISQQEPRILAFLSGDKELTTIFTEGRDAHLEVTRAIFHDPTIEKSDPRRSEYGKVINLATSYGMTAKGLMMKIKCTEEEAEKFLEAYFDKFKDVKMYIQKYRQFAERYEYVRTSSGRTLWLNPYSKTFQNNAINSPIQGGAAELVKLWLSKIHETCMGEDMYFPVNLVVHDEIVMDVFDEDVDDFIIIAQRALADAAQVLYPNIPFVSEPHVGTTWRKK